MKNKATLIFIAALAGIIVFQFLFYKCESGRYKKEISNRDAQIAACINAPVKIDTVTVPVYLTDTIHLPSSYVVIKKVTDTAWLSNVEKREYNGTYVHPQFEVHWTANVTGELNDLYIKPPSLIKSLVITKEKTVDLTQYITEKPKEKSHLYTTFGGTVLTDKFWGVDAGLMYVRKEGWGLYGTLGTDFSNMIYRGGLVIRLK